MSLVSRSIKAKTGTTAWEDGGETNYILAAEHNADLDILYNDYNGNINNDNISATAGILYAKLDLTLSIVDGDIAPGADINGSKFADDSIANAKLIDATVAEAKVATGNRLAARSSGDDTASLTLSTAGAWTVLSGAVVAAIVSPVGGGDALLTSQFFLDLAGLGGGSGDDCYVWFRIARVLPSSKQYAKVLGGYTLGSLGGGIEKGGGTISLVQVVDTVADDTNTYQVEYYRLNVNTPTGNPVVSPTVAGAPADAGDGDEFGMSYIGLWSR